MVEALQEVSDERIGLSSDWYDRIGRDVRDLFPVHRDSPLSWGLDAADWQAIHDFCVTRVSNGKTGKSSKASARRSTATTTASSLPTLVENWLDEVERRAEPCDTAGLELLAVAHLLRDVQVAAPEIRARLRDTFAQAWCAEDSVNGSDVNSGDANGGDANGCDANVESASESEGDLSGVDPRDHAWRRVELPLTLAAVFSADQRRDAWARQAADQLNRAWAAWVDPEGMPAASLLPHLPAIFASWTRSRHLWRAAGVPGWTDNHAMRFDALVADVRRLRRWNGTCAGSPLDGPSLDSALSFAESGKRGDAPARAEPATPTDYSEFARLAACRSHAGANGLSVVAAFPGDNSRLEISLAKQMFLAGAWRLRVESDGRERTPTGSWHEVSWFSDEDADYLELGIELTEGWYVRRHMILVRDARLLFAGDAVFGGASGRISYEAEIPLGPDIRFVPETETNDGKLVGPRGQAKVLPLALPEWRTPGGLGGARQGAVGEVTTGERSLRWSLCRSGQRLFAPLVISCDPRTNDAPLTWRQLTVAETRQIVSDDIAVAFRVQIDRKQWFFYRSLGGFGNRTVLGQNVSGQFVSGELLKNGLLHGFVETEMEVRT